jgi:hypothetical protein
MKLGNLSVLLTVFTLVMIGCNLEPSTTEEDWSTFTLSLFGTAYSDVDITVQTDVEDTQNYTVLVGDLPWQFYQFSFMDAYSIQVSAPSEASPTTGTTTSNSGSYNTGSETIYTVIDAAASFGTQTTPDDIIFNDDGPAGASTRVYGVANNQYLYIFADASGQNIFDPGSYPSPVDYTIYCSHELRLRVTVTDSDNNKTETTYEQQNYIIDLQITN